MLFVEKVKRVFNSKYVSAIKKLLLNGTSPKLIAIGISGAIVIGLFPVLGSTTILCTVFALVFRLNLPLVQLINFSVYPLQFILLVPLMKLGELIFGIEKLKYGLNEMVDLISNDALRAIAILWNVTMQAIGAWLLLAPVIALLFFFILHPIIKRIRI
ncbi:MAG: hypothetical protein CVV23_04505 [Ignavibacteriae bacterium HGW-Ignavibacteriae-2]|jgi:uncharacterized protein (DUF2062 family)|nr:MAG: hypothetical protein CVV23_04505 [Ignavibacteriae bacterium HGW-Ignavibacteriae-2]